MSAPSYDHRRLLDDVVAALSQDDPSFLRALAAPGAWEAGLSQLWKLRGDDVVFSAAGALSPRAERTLGCLRFQRRNELGARAGIDQRSVFLLLTERTADRGTLYEVAGVYAEVPLALGWMRGWIGPGQKIDTLPSDEEALAFAETLVTVPHGRRGAYIARRFGAEPAQTARADTLLFEGPARILGIHGIPSIGRVLVGIGVDLDELWLVLERDPSTTRLRLVEMLRRGSLTALLTGARSLTRDGSEITDLFIERLRSAVLPALAPAPVVDNKTEAPFPFPFHDELVQRLDAAFTRPLPADDAVYDAVRDSLPASAAHAKDLGELVLAVLGRLADRSEQSARATRRERKDRDEDLMSEKESDA